MDETRSAASDRSDARLFRESVGDVEPLRRGQRVEHPRALPRPVPAQRLRDERAVLRESLAERSPWDSGSESGEELYYTRDGISPQTVRKLRRGHWVIQSDLDLHGCTVEQARERVGEFLRECARRGQRCVRIVHGKGLRSWNREPVLKRRIAGWLIQRADVLAFCQARASDGGGGAVIVLLRGTGR